MIKYLYDGALFRNRADAKRFAQREALEDVICSMLDGYVPDNCWDDAVENLLDVLGANIGTVVRALGVGVGEVERYMSLNGKNYATAREAVHQSKCFLLVCQVVDGEEYESRTDGVYKEGEYYGDLGVAVGWFNLKRNLERNTL